jgi:hypothetical protein
MPLRVDQPLFIGSNAPQATRTIAIHSGGFARMKVDRGFQFVGLSPFSVHKITAPDDSFQMIGTEYATEYLPLAPGMTTLLFYTSHKLLE